MPLAASGGIGGPGDVIKVLTRLQGSEVGSDENARHGDRWGHRDAPR